MTFLRQTARYIYAKHSDTAQQPLDHVWVILPTRRAVSVFQQELANLADRPMLAPHMLAVDDFITEAAGVQLIDNVSLLFELYDVFRELDKKVEFDQFVGWASVLLNDLDRIDQYRIDPNHLFEYLTEAKAIERWTPENHQHTPSLPTTTAVSNYFGLFSNLKAAYYSLRKRLLTNGLAYRGMAYRLLADNVRDKVLTNPDYEKIYFVGFNALTASEEHIIRVLTGTTKAELIWDVDSYYLNDPEQEAGYFLRQYKNEKGLPGFKNRTGFADQGEAETVAIGNTLTTTPKHMRMVGVPTASLQAKVAGQLVDQGEEGDKPGGRTVIVLADETLLVPVLYSLNETVSDLNVTMGLSLRNSLLFTLIDTMFEMQRTLMEFKTADGSVGKIPKFHHRQVVKLLNHPFVRQYEKLHGLLAPDRVNELPKPLLDWILSEVVTGKRAYLGEHDMLELGQGDALFSVLFKRWRPTHPTDAINALFSLVDLLREVYRHSQDTIEIEYLYLFFSLLKQLETTLIRQAATPNSPAVTVRSFQQFLYELVRQTTIPFTSEGDSRVQLMGLLETRTLDFERVIILSANEGMLPQSRRMNSLIPFDIAIEVGLPTYREQEAVTAYHLYRLLQRASDVTFLYTTTADAYGNGKGEPSRFLRQIEHELVKAAHGNIHFSKPLLRAGDGASRTDAVILSVPKTDTIRQTLKTYLTIKGLYPTALNHFVACSMRFYFERVVGIREEEEVDERIDSAEFGTWLHNTMENLDKNYRMLDLPVTPELVQEVLDAEYRNLMGGRVADTGYNLLFYQLAKDLMQAFQKYQNDETLDKGIRVLATERTLQTYLPVDIGGEVVQVKIGGKIDRLEQLGNGRIRIVDYKSGKVDLPSKIENLADSLTTLADKDNKWEKIRQLWLYKYLILKENQYPNTTVEAGFYSLRTFQKDPTFLTNRVAFSDDDNRDTYIAETETLIQQMVKRMFDTAEPFAMTDNIETCKYCNYTKICGR
ncbi:PD-(D/E)XK nuclease family protein [Fibrivirga algicola]|uniref:PD-(D/E)XK nuclease family protein n=1 Tax=Fibrivirga algicola TaxID=2950420 RepID=A0ABX0QFK3_9BACT|nr:PD-(D/E)XK nuclease family protein [Fibrivirga algicola]NID11165.1 PD-(D/E)XK nuclease family protein [Fibrivirga algicola]